MRPESASRLPVIRLNSVDLPAPFGPMMPKACPRGTSKVTPSVTFNAPNDFETFSRASIIRTSLSGRTRGDFRPSNASGQGLHLAAGWDVLRRSVLDHHEVETSAVLLAPLPPTSGVLQTFLAAKGGSPAPVHATLPTTVDMSVAAMAAAMALASPASETRPITFAATSNSEWTKPIGCVHGRPVLAVKSAARSAELWPVDGRLERMRGRPPDFRGQVVAGIAQRLDRLRNRMAFATVAAFGLKPCWRAWFQKVVKSGG